jgi:hypothetical protein
MKIIQQERMKHSELIQKTRELLDEKLFARIVEIRKGASSGINYINVIFANDEDRKAARKLLTSRPEPYHNCEARYGIGLIINQYFFS